MSDQSKIISWLKANAKPGDRVVDVLTYIYGKDELYSLDGYYTLHIDGTGWLAPEIWRKEEEQKFEAIGTPRINETWILVAKYPPPADEPEAWKELVRLIGIADSRSTAVANCERMEAAWPEIERRVAKMIEKAIKGLGNNA